MKSIRNDNLEKIKATELTGEVGFSSQTNRCNTMGSSETIRAPLNKTDVSIYDLKLKYEQMKSENTLLKKKIDVFQSKKTNNRSTFQMKSSSKEYLSNMNSYSYSNSNTNKDLSNFAQSVNDFLQTINKMQAKNISLELENNLTDLQRDSALDKQIKQTFNKEKCELSKLCLKFIGNLQPNQTFISVLALTPTSKKSINIKSDIKTKQDSLKDLLNYSQSDLSHQSSQITFLAKEKKQFKSDFNHLNNAHMLEISKNKLLTEQLLKLESETATLNIDKALLKDKYLKLLEEKETLILAMNSQIVQLKKIASTSTQGVEAIQKKNNLLIQENKEMQTEIDRLNKLMDVFQSNKKDLDIKEKVKAKKTDSQLNVLNKKNTDLSVKVAAITTEKRKMKQDMQEKEIELSNLKNNITELIDVNQRNLVELQELKSAFDLEQKKNNSLKTENDEINMKLQELLEAFNYRFNNGMTEAMEKMNKEMLIEIKEKDKEIERLNEMIQNKNNNITIEKGNIIALINKHKNELNGEKGKYHFNISKLQENHVKEKNVLNDQIKQLINTIKDKEEKFTTQLTELIENKTKSKELVNFLVKENNSIEKQNKLQTVLNLLEANRIENESKIKELTEDNIIKRREINKTAVIIESKNNLIQCSNDSIQQLQLDNKEKEVQMEPLVKFQSNTSKEINSVKGASDVMIQQKENQLQDYSVLVEDIKQSVKDKDSIIELKIDEIKALNTTIKKLRDENEILKKEILSNNNKISQITHSITQFNNLNIKQRNENDSIRIKLEKDIQDLKATNILQEELIKQNQIDMTSFIQNNTDLSNIVKSKSEELTDMKQTADNVEKQLFNSRVSENSLHQIIKLKDDELNKLSVLHSDLINELLIIRNNVTQGEELITSLKEKNKQNEIIIEEYKTKLHSINHELIELTKQNELLQKENMNHILLLNTKSTEINVLKTKNEEHNQNVVALETDIKIAKDQFSEMKLTLSQEIATKVKLLKEAKEINDSQGKTINDLNTECSDQENTLVKVIEDSKQKDNCIIQLNNAIQNKDTELQSLIKLCDPKENQIKEMAHLLKSKNNTIDNLQLQMNFKEEELKNLTGKIAVLEKEILSLSQELFTNKKVITDFENLNGQRDKKINDKEMQLLSLTEENKQTASLNIQLNDQIMYLQNELDSSQKEYDTNRDLLNKKESEINSLQSTFKMNQKTINELKNLTTEQKSKIQFLNETITNKESEIKENKEMNIVLQTKMNRSLTDFNYLKVDFTTLNDQHTQTVQNNLLLIESKDKDIQATKHQVNVIQKELEQNQKIILDNVKEINDLSNNYKQISQKYLSEKSVYDESIFKLKNTITTFEKDREECNILITDLTDKLVLYKEKESEWQNNKLQLEDEKKQYINNNKLLNELKISNTQLKQEVEIKCKESTKTKKQINILLQEQTQLKMQIDHHASENSNQKIELQKKNKTLEESMTQRESNTKVMGEMKQELEKLEINNSEQRKQIIELNELNKQLKQEIKEQCNDSNSKQEEMNQLLSNYINLKKDHLDSLKMTKITQEKLEKELTLNKELIEEFKNKIQQLNHNNETLSQDYTAKCKENSLLINDIKGKDDIISNITSSNSYKDKELKDLKHQIYVITQENTNQKEIIIEMSQNIQQLTTEKSELNKIMTLLHEENKVINIENLELKNNIINLNNEIENILEVNKNKDDCLNETQKEKVSKENEKGKSLIIQLKERIFIYIKHKEKLIFDNEQLLTNNNQIKTQINKLTIKVNSHLQEIETLQFQLNQTYNQNEEKDKHIEYLNKEIKHKNKQIEKLDKKYKILAKETDELTNSVIPKLKEENKHNNELIKTIEAKNNQLIEKTNEQSKNIEILIKTKQKIENNEIKLQTEIEKLKANIELSSKEFFELTNKLMVEEKAKTDLKIEINENKSLIQTIEEQKSKYDKEIKDATKLIFQKLSLTNEDNGITYSLIELINQIDINKIKLEEEVTKIKYNPNDFSLIATINLSFGKAWSLFKTKKTPNTDNNNSFRDYQWVLNDNINVNEFDEPLEKFNTKDSFKDKEKAHQKEIQILQKEQDELLDKLTKSENDYKLLNLQIAKILNQQKNIDKTQEKKLYQMIEELKEENKKLGYELQQYRVKNTNNKVLGVSFINELNNNSNFMDDSNVEDLLNEMTTKKSTINTKSILNYQQIKTNFEKLLSEIPLTITVKSTISSILKQIQFSHDDINQMLNRYRSGVISLHPSTSNGKLPWNANKI